MGCQWYVCLRINNTLVVVKMRKHEQSIKQITVAIELSDFIVWEASVFQDFLLYGKTLAAQGLPVLIF